MEQLTVAYFASVLLCLYVSGRCLYANIKLRQDVINSRKVWEECQK